VRSEFNETKGGNVQCVICVSRSTNCY